MVPVSYNCRNLAVRWKTTCMTAGGFTLVVAALVLMLAFVNGVRTVCSVSGEPENVVVLIKGNTDEVLSQMNNRVVSEVENVDGIARSQEGGLLASRELFMVVHHFNPQRSAFDFLQVRGVLPAAYQVHTTVEVVSGRRFRPGRNEVIVGKGVLREFGLDLGDSFDMGRKQWTVAGMFEAGGAAFESEIWCDLHELASQFRREGIFSTVVLRAGNTAEAEKLAGRLVDSRRISVEARTETAYYQKQAEQTESLMTAAWIIAWFMGVGAVFGVMNTMFAAINQRTKDIAVLRIMGFGAKEILLSFLLEALLIAGIGGAVGAGLGYAANGLTRTAAIGARQIGFAFHVDGWTLLLVVLFSLGMGLLGGLIPALSAMRVSPIEALR